MSEFTREWIIKNAQPILDEYSDGITVRQLYYRLVAQGMTNDNKHYKKVVAAMTKARWSKEVDVEAFVDRERTMYGRTEADNKNVETEVEQGKRQVKAWMNNYRLERWSNQPIYPEVWIEKKALQGVFEDPALFGDVGLFACKGYPSITALNDAKKRFKTAINTGKEVVVLYFGDYDPSGEDIPRSLQENLRKFGIDVTVKRIALHPEQIEKWNLPGVPPKQTDSRTATWDGEGAVELDAVLPQDLKKMCEEAIEEVFDKELHDSLKELEAEERIEYQKQLKEFVETLQLGDTADDDDDDVGGDDDE